MTVFEMDNCAAVGADKKSKKPSISAYLPKLSKRYFQKGVDICRRICYYNEAPSQG